MDDPRSRPVSHPADVSAPTGAPPSLAEGMMAVPAPPDAPAPDPVRVPESERAFEHEGTRWIARAAGGGAGGTGGLGLAHFVAVHFFREGAERPAYEALLAWGRFEHLHRDELAALLAAATPIPPA